MVAGRQLPQSGKPGYLNSTGQRDAHAWGRRAAWVDYSGRSDSTVVGVTLMDHPDNLRHPTWRHARDYGPLAANPFGMHDFENAPAGRGDFVLPAGATLPLRYRLCLHEGDADDARIPELWRAWLASEPRPAHR